MGPRPRPLQSAATMARSDLLVDDVSQIEDGCFRMSLSIRHRRGLLRPFTEISRTTSSAAGGSPSSRHRPGSGKTFTLIEVLSALVVKGMPMAVAAQTNSQADDICPRSAKDHPEVRIARFASRGLDAPADFPASVAWITERAGLGTGPGVTVATTAKWSLTDIAEPFDLLAIDEAWQMSWADLMQCALVSENIRDDRRSRPDPAGSSRSTSGDGRLRREPRTRPRRRSCSQSETLNGIRFVGSLPACRRLPNESVDFVKPFYDFDFDRLRIGWHSRSRPTLRASVCPARRWPSARPHHPDT